MNPTVSSHGYGDAEIFFVSGYPLNADLISGYALSGHNENTLNSFLSDYKLNVKNTYRSLYIREKLNYSGVNVKKLKKALTEVDTTGYEQLLLNELKEVNPNVIVPLDDIALSVVFPHVNAITKPKNRKFWMYCYRGSVLPLRLDWQQHFNHPIRIIPTFSPQILYNEHAARAFVSIDFKRIVENRYNQSPITEYGLRWVCKSANEFRRFIERALERQPSFLVFDVETYGGMLTCIGFSFDGWEGISIPLTAHKIPKSECILLWALVAKLLSHPIPKVNQNITYDWTILERHGFEVTNVIGDTMLAAGIIYPELPKGLDFLCSIYTDIAYYKDEGKEFDPKKQSFDKLYLYNAMDTIGAHVTYQKQLMELEESGTKTLYHEEIVPLIQIYKNINATGIRVDNERKQKLNEKYKAHFDSNLMILRQLIGDDKFNPMSPQQVGKLIYEELKFPKRTKTDPETGKFSYKTDKETLDDLIINHGKHNKTGELGVAILNRIIVSRKFGKIREYVNTPLHPDGRFRSTSNLCGTETGRSSFSKTIDEIIDFTAKTGKRRLGRSLQTITKHGFHLDEDVFEDIDDKEIAKDLRSMFVPDRGYVFVEADGSQAEARHVAVLAEDYDLLASFDKKPKIHAKTAGLVFGIDPFIITKDEPKIPKIGIAYYDLGKRLRHAGHYKMQAGRLMQMTHLDYYFCHEALEKFHGFNPKIRSVFHFEVEAFLRRYHYLITPYGRRRDFFSRIDDNVYKEAIAYIPQSGVSDHTKFSIRRILAELSWVRFAAEQHDGLLAIVPKDQIIPYAMVTKRIMERPLNFRNCSLSRDFDLIVPAEISVGEDNWQEMKEIEVPKEIICV